MISYNKLWKTMEQKEITKYQLVHKHNFSQSTITRLRKNEPVNITTIEELCKVLNCKIQDIVEYIPDNEL